MTTNPKAERLAALEAQAADLAEQIHALRTEILAAATPGDVIEAGGAPRWRVAPGKRTFTENIARATLPPAIVEQATVAKLDGAAVRRISPALWEACCIQGQPFLVSVK